MPRDARTHAGSTPLFLGLCGLGAAGLLALAGIARGSRRVPARPASTLAEDVAVASPAPVIAAGEREPVLEGARAALDDPEAGAPTRNAAPTARKEREFVARFLALERARPGALEERAEALLAGDGPAPEKVALLRALGESDSRAQLRWLEHAASTLPDDSGPHGVSVARYALGTLADTARAEREALPALRRLAFETRGLAADLRRSAALALARCGDEPALGDLRVALAREHDELLVAGVLAALEERPDSRPAQRLLRELSPPTQGVAGD